jgi:ubiquinone/menaquinone biosynthesis C-methylase UbiE
VQSGAGTPAEAERRADGGIENGGTGRSRPRGGQNLPVAHRRSVRVVGRASRHDSMRLLAVFGRIPYTMTEVEKTVRDFYDNFGWRRLGDSSGEEMLFRKFDKHYYRYHDHVNQRTINCFSGCTGKLLIAGGGDLPSTHVEIASQFKHVCCLDISKNALEISKAKLGSTQEYILGSILTIPKPSNYFDAIYCAHVVYHVDKDLQAKAIAEFVRVVKPNGKIVIIYSNPRSLANRILSVLGKAKQRLVWSFTNNPVPSVESAPPLYFYTHPLEWWNQFCDKCCLALLPWDVLSAEQERRLYVKGPFAKVFYRLCSWYEERYAIHAVKHWAYPIILLDKKANG